MIARRPCTYLMQLTSLESLLLCWLSLHPVFGLIGVHAERRLLVVGSEKSETATTYKITTQTLVTRMDHGIYLRIHLTLFCDDEPEWRARESRLQVRQTINSSAVCAAERIDPKRTSRAYPKCLRIYPTLHNSYKLPFGL